MAERFYWTDSNGQVLILDTPYRLTDIAGVGVPAAEIQTQKAPFQQGKTLVDQLFNERTVTLEVSIVASSRADLLTYRARLASLFNPLSGEGVLAWEQPDGTVYLLDAVPEGCEFPGGDASGQKFQRAIVTLIAANPFWYQAAQVEASQLEGGLEFDIEFPVQFATVLTASSADNEGDVATPVTLTFVGPATNPRVDNLTTGKHLQVTYVLQDGESIRINTAFGAKEVTHIDTAGDETNIMNWLTATSEFFDLQPGMNSLSYIEEGGNPTAMALVQWRNRYVGR